MTGEVRAESTETHADTITGRLLELDGYSPIRLTTSVPDIVGAVYQKPDRWGGRTDTIPFTQLSGAALSIETEGEDVWVVAQVSPDVSPSVLRPESIRHVQADHPYGNHMPLNGRREMSAWPVAPHFPGTPTFGWPPKVLEYDWHDWMVTGQQPNLPGISTVRAYNAQSRNWRNGLDKFRDVPTLEEAMAAQKGMPITHLISKVAPYRGWSRSFRSGPDYVVTSCSQMDKLKDGRGVKIERPRHPEDELPAPLDIDMYDFPMGITEEELLEAHIERWFGLSTERYSRKPDVPMSQFEADAVYMYMSED